MSVYDSFFAMKSRAAPLSQMTRGSARKAHAQCQLSLPNTSVPCFTEGTLIRTGQADAPIESLTVGDSVMTKDRGPQSIRWIGRTVTQVDPASAPVVFSTGALGNTHPLILSPDHRVLLTGWRCAMVAGTQEVLAAAKDLVNGRDIRWFEGETVTYLHLAFDQHEIVSTAGLFAESFHLESLLSSEMSDGARTDIVARFPDVGASPESYGPLVRPQVQAYEARLIRP